MKNYIPKQIMLLSGQIVKDATLIMCMQKLFEWANQAGLNGYEVCNLQIVDPDKNNILDNYYKIWCQIKCSEDQRKSWDEYMKKCLEDAFLDECIEDKDE